MERAYTLKEIDDLRDLCRDKWMYRSFFPEFARGHIGRTWCGSERDIGTEELVRTYMLAGITAEQIRAEHAAKVGTHSPVTRQAGASSGGTHGEMG